MQTLITLTTHPDLGKAKILAQTLVQEALVACVNIVPNIFSVYHWQGKIENESECLIVAKTNSEKLPALEARIKQLHPYTTPEFVALETSHVESAYLAWVESCLSR